jgi:glutamyl-tRNA synthetase
MSVRVRFAPSPTGSVHIGNIRVAIFNWLFARHEGGSFLLRVEDTDRERSTPEAVSTLCDAMRWLGLDWDEEPVYQSSRRAAHVAAAESLLECGAAYREDKGGKGPCVLFRMPPEDAVFHDEIKGELRKSSQDVADFVIVRSDGSPVFHLANVVDDMAMRVTHVLRGDDHIENTYRHVALFRALGAEPPRYAHFPMIVNAAGKPYSKRDGDAFVGDFRERGFLAPALFNYLSLLGWAPGDDREKMSRSEMVEAFSLSRVKNGPAQMDAQKLMHMNGLYMAELPPSEFCAAARRVADRFPWGRNADENRFRRVCALMQSRTKLYDQVALWRCFFDDELTYEEKAVRKGLKKTGMRSALTGLIERLAAETFVEDRLETALHEVEQAQGIRAGKLNFPVRVAVTGAATGAGLYETMALLGRESCLRRLRYAATGLCES